MSKMFVPIYSMAPFQGDLQPPAVGATNMDAKGHLSMPSPSFFRFDLTIRKDLPEVERESVVLLESLVATCREPEGKQLEAAEIRTS